MALHEYLESQGFIKESDLQGGSPIPDIERQLLMREVKPVDVLGGAKRVVEAVGSAFGWVGSGRIRTTLAAAPKEPEIN